MTLVYREAFERLFQDNLGLQTGERCLIVTDRAPLRSHDHPFENREQLLEIASEAAIAMNLAVDTHTYDARGSHGSEPPVELWELAFQCPVADIPGIQAVIEKDASDAEAEAVYKELQQRCQSQSGAMLVLAFFSISHTRFRKWLCDLTGLRAATMPGCEPALLTGVMHADWSLVAARSEAVARILTEAAAIEIRSHNDGGTEEAVLHLELGDRTAMADTGILHQPGDFGNLPGGEGFIAPLEHKAHGSFFAYCADGKTRARFDVNLGRFQAVTHPQDSYIEALVQNLHDNRFTNLAELGVGTNEAARDTASVLEGEKILGTCHIAFGDNKSFGGTVSAPFHRDYIVPEPTLTAALPHGRKIVLIDAGEFQLSV